MEWGGRTKSERSTVVHTSSLEQHYTERNRGKAQLHGPTQKKKIKASIKKAPIKTTKRKVKKRKKRKS